MSKPINRATYPTAMVHELVYVSRATLSDLPISVLDNLLRQSRKKNHLLGITGVLLYHKGEFIQMLEGEPQAVKSVFYGAIARDPRHRRVFVCWEQDKKDRDFREWQMGFSRGTDLVGKDLAGIEGYLGDGVAGLDMTAPRSTGRSLLLALYRTIGAT